MIEKRVKELYIFQREIDNLIQKVINFYIIGNIKQQNELKNMMNVPQAYPVNQEKFNDEECNLYPEKSEKIQATIDEIKRNNSTEKNHKIIFKKHIFELQTNNEIKVLKNNKVVYVNKILLNKYSTARGIKKLKKFNFVIRKKRSSIYRSVSKNGSKWQVLMMINNKKCYLGSYPSEDLAARIYDIHAIKSWGTKARTNFVYDNNQIKNIYNTKINKNCHDISYIMTQINNWKNIILSKHNFI